MRTFNFIEVARECTTEKKLKIAKNALIIPGTMTHTYVAYIGPVCTSIS